AGVTDHLHEHVVPRWQGDANFMPVLAATAILPELIPVTYAKLRAELAREIDGQSEVSYCLLSDDDRTALVAPSGRLPRVMARADEALWKAAVRSACELGAEEVELFGWSGESRASESPVSLLLQGRLPDGELPPHIERVPLEMVLAGPDGATISEALRRGE